jgi:hypothetical protein
MSNSDNQNTTIDNNFIQVPVLNKTEALFKRDPKEPTKVTNEISPDVKELLTREKNIITVKTDGTCGIICQDNNNYYLMRRQDVKIGSRNYDAVMKFGKMIEFSGTPCYYVEKIIRGNGKSERNAPLYIFQLTENGIPDIENYHIIGFTPLLHDFGDDKYAISAINGFNGTPEMGIWTTLFDGKLDIPVVKMTVKELMRDKNLLTVEIMGSKISNKYGFKNDKHFVNPHGSIVYPTEMMPVLDYDSLKKWFEEDSTNRWANVEGLVVHVPSVNRRFKLHRGHLGLERTWQIKKESGIQFIQDLA